MIESQISRTSKNTTALELFIDCLAAVWGGEKK